MLSVGPFDDVTSDTMVHERDRCGSSELWTWIFS
jgi:hypothetical protein